MSRSTATACSFGRLPDAAVAVVYVVICLLRLRHRRRVLPRVQGRAGRLRIDMCGIAGVLAFDRGTFRVTEPLVDAHARDAWLTAAPTAADLGRSPTAASASATGGWRSSISPAPAAQPMTNEDGSLWVVFNGEIYNHAELRAELTRSAATAGGPITPTPRCILHAFEEWGIDVRPRFRGMFAFALWDARARELWLVRDRIGIKPLYYSVAPRPPDVRVRDQGAARGSGAAPRGPRGGAVPLPVVPDDARAADAVRRHQKAAAGHVAARRRGRHDRRAGATGTSGTTSSRSSRHRRRDRRAGAGRTAHVGRAAQGQRRPGRRVPVRRPRLEHQRRVVLGRRIAAGQDVLDRLRPRYAGLPNELDYARQMAARVGADHHEYLLERRRRRRLPAADGRSCRTSRSRTRSACRSTTSRSSHARTASSSVRSAKALTSCSSAIRTGCRRSSASVDDWPVPRL